MGFFETLYKIYPNCKKASENSEFKLLPICHTRQTAHIEITIDGNGVFKNAEILNKEKTIIPATEDSAARSGKACFPHPLADKIQYCAKDYKDYGQKDPYFEGFYNDKKEYVKGYYDQLKEWCDSDYKNEKVCAILKYIEKGTLVKNLIDEKILWVDKNNKLLTNVEKDKEEGQRIFKFLLKSKDKKDQGDALIRWRVISEGDPQEKTWEDEAIRTSWINFVKADKENKYGIDYITGKNVILSEKHPKNINPRETGAKLVSSNDKANFTYRGRFLNSEQALGIGFEVSQQAHAVLKWLLDNDRKQAYFNDKEAYVAFRDCDNTKRISINIGQMVGKKLIKIMRGYYNDIGDEINDKTMIIGFDVATKGRLSCIYYKDLQTSDFFKRIENWNERYKWKFRIRCGKKIVKEYDFVGAPSVDLISNVYFHKKGKYDIRKGEVKIKKRIAKEILHCILENKKVPDYITEHFIRRASNIESLDYNQWQSVSSIACSLYKGNNEKENIKMELEEQRRDRDYLYGRLLAAVHFYERQVLLKQESKRLTNAQRCMTQFVLKPYSTWSKLYLKFNRAYRAKLQGDWVDKKIQEIFNLFEKGVYERNDSLTGLWIAGYTLQIEKLEIEKQERIKQLKEKNNDNIKQ